MKIVFTGAQGVGKTTLLDILDKCFTTKEPITYIRNFTRDMVEKGYQINNQGNDSTQLAIMKMHNYYIQNEPNFVADRCALDGLVYTYHLFTKDQVTKETLDVCEDVFKSIIKKYDYIFYMTPEFPITGDSYRSADSAYQSTIAQLFEDFIQSYNVPVIKLSGTVGDRLKLFLNKTGDFFKC